MHSVGKMGEFGYRRLIGYLSVSALLSLSMWFLLLLPSFLVGKGWSYEEIGWAMGVFFLVSLLARVVSGHLADRYGNVPTALAGTAIASLGGLFYLAALWSSLWIIPARILHGAGSALISTGALIQLIRSVPMELRGRMIGYFGLPGFIMLGVGPFLAERLVRWWGFAGPFGLVLVIFLLLAGILARLPRPLDPEQRKHEPFVAAFQANFPRLKAPLVMSFFFGLCFSSWHTFLAPVTGDLGAGAVSSFGLGYAVGAIGTRLGISQRLDTGRRRLAAIATLIFYGIGLALVPHGSNLWQIGTVGLLCGLAHGIYYPAMSSIAAERFHPLHTGQGMTLYTSVSSLGMFLGPPIWGRLADLGGYGLLFGVAGAALAVNAVVFIAIQSRPVRLRGALGETA